MTARLGRTGAALALLYAVVAVSTAALSSRPVRPLFDGFAPPVLYNWVSPPPSRAGDNTVPKPFEREFSLGPDGSDATNASTDDGQMIVGLDKGSVPPHPPDAAVKVRLVPRDPATLGPLPPGLRPISNAYQAVLSYVPSQSEIAQLAVKGTVSLTATEPKGKLLSSPDGAQWQERDARPYGQDNGLFAELEASGYFVLASSSIVAPAPGATSRRIVLIGIAAVVPILGAVLVLRLPSPVAAQFERTTRRAPAKSPTASARKKARKAGRKARKRRRR